MNSKRGLLQKKIIFIVKYERYSPSLSFWCLIIQNKNLIITKQRKKKKKRDRIDGGATL